MSKRTKEMWEYLESTGVLERGIDDEIKEAKKAYRKIYLLKYKQNQRSKKPEFNISFSNENGEYGKVELAAKKHNLTVTAFIRKSVIAYIERSYIVPDKLQIAKLEQLISQCLNEIQLIIKLSDPFEFERDERYKMIEDRISQMESDIDSVFRHPPIIE